MEADSNSTETSTIELLRSILSDEPGEIVVINPAQAMIGTLCEVLKETENPLTVRLLARNSVLKAMRRNFYVGSAAADLIENGTLSLRATDKNHANSLVITSESVVSLVSAGAQIAGIVTDDTEFVESAREHWQSEWESAEEFDLRTPGRSRVEHSLSEKFGSEEAEDFQTMIDALATARGSDDEDEIGSRSRDNLDEVGVSLLMAAKHGELLYDISTWGEDVGLASRATFSRVKTQLEEQGLITTENVPIDVGRPRLRLWLGDEELREADAIELVSGAHGRFTRTGA